MSDFNTIEQMISASQSLPRAESRVEKALQLFDDLNGTELTQVIMARLAGDTSGQRGLGLTQQDEEPSSIFIDAIRFSKDEALVLKLRFAVVQTLRLAAISQTPNVEVLGEACYLAAAIGANDAIDLLVGVIDRQDLGKLRLWNSETIQIRAMRALVGLLSATPSLKTAQLKQLFEKLVSDAECRMLALTGLIGLWPSEFDTHMVPPSEQRQLSICLELGGFARARQMAR